MINKEITQSINKFIKKSDQYNKSGVRLVEKLPTVDQNPAFSKEALYTGIKNIPSMTYEELRIFIERNMDNILKDSINGNQEYIKYFTNIDFLDAFINVLETKQYYSPNIIVWVNNICYDYITQNKKDNETSRRILKIANIVNRHKMPKLLGLGLPPSVAITLLMARYSSSTNLFTCIKRLNFVIITQPKTLMSYDMMLEICKILYDDIARQFQYFMLDVIPQYSDENPTWVTEEVEEVNSVLNLVILDLLNQQPLQTIKAAISDYILSYGALYSKAPYRFALKNLSDDYYRINMVVQDLMSTNQQAIVI